MRRENNAARRDVFTGGDLLRHSIASRYHYWTTSYAC